MAILYLTDNASFKLKPARCHRTPRHTLWPPQLPRVMFGWRFIFGGHSFSQTGILPQQWRPVTLPQKCGAARAGAAECGYNPNIPMTPFSSNIYTPRLQMDGMRL